MDAPGYTYRAFVTRVVDGDTIDVTLDLGCCVYVKERLRLANIDAPEMRGTEKLFGRQSKVVLAERVEGQHVIVQTEKDKRGKYGRYIATVWHEGTNINKWLIDNGHAEWRRW